MPYSDDFLSAQVTKATRQWWDLACQGHLTLFLCYRPTNLETGDGGELRVFPGTTEPFPAVATGETSWEVALPERLPLNASRDRVALLILQTARRLPILPTKGN